MIPSLEDKTWKLHVHIPLAKTQPHGHTREAGKFGVCSEKPHVQLKIKGSNTMG